MGGETMNSTQSIDKKVDQYVKEQFKKLIKNKNRINIEVILDYLADELKPSYVIISKTPDELILKIDRKKNIKDIESEVKNLIVQRIKGEFDVNLLFRFLSVSNEFIIRSKRKIE